MGSLFLHKMSSPKNRETARRDLYYAKKMRRLWHIEIPTKLRLAIRKICAISNCKTAGTFWRRSGEFLKKFCATFVNK